MDARGYIFVTQASPRELISEVSHLFFPLVHYKDGDDYVFEFQNIIAFKTGDPFRLPFQIYFILNSNIFLVFFTCICISWDLHLS